MTNSKKIDIDSTLSRFQKQVGKLPSEFASNTRLSQEEISDQMRLVEAHFKQSENISELLNNLHFVIIILNSHRQIIFANRAFLILVNRQQHEVQGLRLGEAVSCTHALTSDYGCGTCPQCSQCPAVKGQLDLLEHNKTTQEDCAILTYENDTLELRLSYSPLPIDGETYILATAEDIHEKNHRDMLERTVLHDIQNSIGALSVFSEELADLLREASNPRLHSLSKMIGHISTIVTDELQAHTQLVNLEVDSVRITVKEIDLDQFLNEIIDLYSTFPWAKKCYFLKNANQHGIRFHSDPVLLKRILVNMLKNAAEAEAEAGKNRPPISVSWGKIDAGICISVHNESIIPKAMQLLMFRKYSSTKGKGRGVGTFSIKVLTERYLKGRVLFESREGKGTDFRIELPLAL